MGLRFSSHVLARIGAAPLLVSVARLRCWQKSDSSCTHLAMTIGCFVASGGNITISKVKGLVAAAEELHEELSGGIITPLEASQHYPDAHHIGTFEAPVVPPPELPLCAGGGGAVLSASGMADAVDQGLRQLASDRGFLALTGHAHTTLLLPRECGSDGHCRKAVFVNLVGSMLQPTGKAGGSKEGYAICIEGATPTAFKHNLGSVLQWQFCDRYAATGFPDQNSREALCNGQLFQVDVFRMGETQLPGF
jgi:hypothetical protein